MNLIEIGEKLVDWLLTHRAKKSAQIDSYIRHIQMACRKLIEAEDPTSDKVSVLHEQLKVIYDLASSKLPTNFIEKEGWNLYRALSSARIYYWLRIVEKADQNELAALFDDRQNKSSSFERLSSLLLATKDRTNKTILLEKLNIDEVRRICLEDIAKLLEMRPFYS